MKAMLLAAGRGERMRPLTDHMPKPLLDVGGRPLIEWTLQALVRAKVSEVVINVSHLGSMIEQRLGDGSSLGLKIAYSREPEPLETAGGIVQALPLLGDGSFIAANADVWSDFDFSSLATRSLNGMAAHLILVENPGFKGTGDFVLDSVGQVSAAGDGESLTFAGISLLSSRLFRRLPPGSRPLAPLLREAMQRGQVSGEKFSGHWLDVGTPERLRAAAELVRSYSKVPE